jgi:hypothetical protein
MLGPVPMIAPLSLSSLLLSQPLSLSSLLLFQPLYLSSLLLSQSGPRPAPAARGAQSPDDRAPAPQNAPSNPLLNFNGSNVALAGAAGGDGIKELTINHGANTGRDGLASWEVHAPARPRLVRQRRRCLRRWFLAARGHFCVSIAVPFLHGNAAIDRCQAAPEAPRQHHAPSWLLFNDQRLQVAEIAIWDRYLTAAEVLHPLFTPHICVAAPSPLSRRASRSSPSPRSPSLHRAQIDAAVAELQDLLALGGPAPAPVAPLPLAGARNAFLAAWDGSGRVPSLPPPTYTHKTKTYNRPAERDSASREGLQN